MAQEFNENAWLMHSRKYTDSRILVDLLAESGCLISGVYRVPSKTQLPQMFKALNVSWRGKHELKQILSIEAAMQTGNLSVSLQGNALYCGLYLNELLVRLMLRDDPHRKIFQAYTQALTMLHHNDELESALRQFEFCMLEELGYGVDFTIDVDGHCISPEIEAVYEFRVDEGFARSINKNQRELFTGNILHCLACGDFSDLLTRRAAKRLSRQCIDKLLGGRVLKSRELFRSE